jgi:hypothetical protein
MLEMLNSVPGFYAPTKNPHGGVASSRRTSVLSSTMSLRPQVIALGFWSTLFILYKYDIYPHNRRVMQGTLQYGRTK